MTVDESTSDKDLTKNNFTAHLLSSYCAACLHCSNSPKSGNLNNKKVFFRLIWWDGVVVSHQVHGPSSGPLSQFRLIYTSSTSTEKNRCEIHEIFQIDAWIRVALLLNSGGIIPAKQFFQASKPSFFFSSFKRPCNPWTLVKFFFSFFFPQIQAVEGARGIEPLRLPLFLNNAIQSN